MQSREWISSKSCSDWFCGSEGTYYHDIIYGRYELLDLTKDGVDRTGSTLLEITKEADGSLSYGLGLPITFSTGVKEQFSIPGTETKEMTFNGITYEKVLIFNTSKYHPNEHMPYYLYYNDSKINIAYYDLHAGFIGFDDETNDLQFRIVD